MAHKIEETVRTIRRRARCYQVLAGLGWFVLAALATVLLLAALDVALRPNDRGLRMMASLAVLASVAFAAWRWLAPTVRARLSDVDAALLIERSLPELRDRLTSALEFLRAPAAEVELGSALLRRSLIIEVDGQLEQFEPGRVLNPRPMLIALSCAAGVALFGVLAWIAAPEAARLSLTHLATPWAEHDWPRQNELEFIDLPERIARGEDLQLTVRDANGKLPRHVDLWILPAGEPESAAERRGMRPAEESMSYRLTNVKGSFLVRAAGGDHENMAWQPIEVIEPPTMSEMSLVLYPPEYAGLAARKSPLRIHALAGTRVAVAGEASKPLDRATIHVESAGETRSYPLVLDDSGEHFSLATTATEPWVIESSGAYWLELVDRQGIAAGSERRWEIEGLPDLPPTLTVASPPASAVATRDAVLPITLTAWDNLAIEFVELRIRRPEAAGEAAPSFEPIVLYRGPARQTPPSDILDEQAGSVLEGETIAIDYEWNLSEMPEMQVGDTLLLDFIAGDYLPQTSPTITQRLQIVPTEDLLQRLSQQQAYVVSRLDEVLDAQLEAQTQVAEIQRQQVEEEEAAASTGDMVRGAELSQRHVRQLLTDRPGGILLEIEQVQATLANSRVDNPDLKRALARLAEQLNELVRAHLLPAEQHLAGAGLAMNEGRVGGLLADTSQQQAAAVALLEALLDEHARFSRYRCLVREVFDLRQQQQDLQRATAEMYALRLAGEEPPAAAGQAQYESLMRRQEDLARRTESLLTRMRRASEQLAEAGLAAADVLGDAVAAAERLQITPDMRRAAEQIELTQLGQASESQLQVLAAFEELLDILANRTERDLNRSAEGLSRAADLLRSATARQEAIRELLEQAGEASGARQKELLDEAARQQDDLAGEMERLARELGRLPAAGAAESTAGAAQAMRQAADEAESDRAEDAAEQAELAEGRLKKAGEQLQQALAQTQQRLLNEKLARLEQTVEAFVERQEAITQETLVFAELQQQGRLNRAERVRLKDLAKTQAALATDLALLAEEIAATPIFSIALEQSGTFMNGAARELDRGNTGIDVTFDQEAAIAHLRRLLESLAAAQENPQAQAGGQGGGGEQGPQDDEERQAVPYLIEQLELLRGIQDEILQATRQLEEERKRDDLTEAQRERIRLRLLDLANMQQELSRLLEPLVPPDPEHGPGLEDDLPEDQSLTWNRTGANHPPFAAEHTALLG